MIDKLDKDWQKQIEDQIVTLSSAVKRLRSGALTDKALIILLQSACGTDSKYRPFSRTDIKLFLDAAENLPALFLSKKKSKE